MLSDSALPIDAGEDYSVRMVSDAETFQALSRLRYEVYRTEVGPELDQLSRGESLEDDLDRMAMNHVVFSGNELIGGFRVVGLGDLERSNAHLEPWRSCLGLGEIEARFAPQEIFHVSRLVVREDHRTGRAATLLLQGATKECLRRGLRVGFSDCSPRLLPFYGHFGFFAHGPSFMDPIFGAKVPLLGFLRDRELLAALGSPLLSLALQHDDDIEARLWSSVDHADARAVAVAGSPKVARGLRLRSRSKRRDSHQVREVR